MMKVAAVKDKRALWITDFLYALAIFVLACLCWRLFYRMSVGYNDMYISDFGWYVNLPTSENKERYRLIGWIFDLMHRAGIGMSGYIAYFTTVIVLIVLANYIYLKFFSTRSFDRRINQLASIMIPFIGPMYVIGLHEFYYRFSFQIFAWHSPTQQSMILASIFATICFIKMYESSEGTNISFKWWLLTMLTGLLSAFAKPAFVIDLIAAMVIAFIIDLLTNKKDSFITNLKKLVLMGISLIPSGLYLLLVMKLEFEGQTDMTSGTVVMNFDRIIDYKTLLSSAVFGLAFAIVIWVANRNLIRNKRYRLIFLIFLMGVLQWALFVEGGARASHGNFTWGRQVGCYIFVLTSVSMAIDNLYDKNFLADRRYARGLYFIVIAILLVLHVGSQLRYFYLLQQGHIYFC